MNDWHLRQIDDVARELETDLKEGLAASEIKSRQERYGPNAVTARRGHGPLLRFLLQFHQPLIYILLAATVITAILGEWVDSGVIFGVVIVNAIIGFIQETKAENAIEALKKIMVTEATVIRGGQKSRIPSEQLVPGDLVVLASGDKVPADMRLTKVRDLQVDESSLTGESVPVEKTHDVLSGDVVLADRHNMSYAGTLVTYGQGQGIVVEIGDKTETGRISQMISEAETLATPLTRQIARFSRLLLYVILALAFLTFLLGVFQGKSPKEMFMAAVALSVSAIPEGLPAVVTITLAIGVSRMAKRRAIIRKLPAVETLGSTTVICSDKTGTLTKNQMTVQEIYAGGKTYTVTGSGYAPEGDILESDSSAALRECLVAGILCNDSRVVQDQGQWRIHGDPTEGSLIVSAKKGGLSEEKAHADLPRIDAIPFESQHQYMATLHETGPQQHKRVYMKGSVEKILERCTDELTADGQSRPCSHEEVTKVAEALAKKGLRLLAFARGNVPPDKTTLRHEDVSQGLTFLGLQAMIDPPRPEAMSAIESCKTAGVQVKMITGDHALTASVIGSQLGLACDAGELGVMTGKEISTFSDEEIRDCVDRTQVFARVAPEQKLRLVSALQSRNQVVAMTGDGVNDAPALKQANIGVAMGITGTDVAKESADMVLTDDNFATIVSAVEEGRAVFDNLTKFIGWTLPTNMGEGLVIIAAIAVGAILPILPVQILWINMTTAVFLGLTLAFEPAESGIMNRPPRIPNSPILTKELIVRILIVGFLMLFGAFGLFMWHQWKGSDLAVARTVTVNVFVFIELFYLYQCRSLDKSVWEIGFFTNPWVIGGSLTMIAIQMLFVYLPVMNRLFGSAPVDLIAWIETLIVAWIAYFLIGVEQKIRKKHRKTIH